MCFVHACTQLVKHMSDSDACSARKIVSGRVHAGPSQTESTLHDGALPDIINVPNGGGDLIAQSKCVLQAVPQEPMIAADGHIHKTGALLQWMMHCTSPVTRDSLRNQPPI